MSGTSIGALFMAGIPTGILMAGFMMLVVYIISKKRNYPKSRRATLPEIWKAFKEAFWALLSPLILIVGMLSGFATPTETAAVAAAYSLFLGVVIYKEMTWQSSWTSCEILSRVSAWSCYLLLPEPCLPG